MIFLGRGLAFPGGIASCVPRMNTGTTGVDYGVVGAYHVDGISGAGLDQAPDRLRQLLGRSLVGSHGLSLPKRK